MDLNRQLTVQRARMDIELDKETIARSVAARKESTDRMIINARQYILDQEKRDDERRKAARRSDYFLSYLGHIETETGLDPYVEDFDVFNTVTRVPIVVVACEKRGVLCLNTLEIGCESSIAPAILRIAGRYGINGRITDSFEKRYDSLPMEELFHDNARCI